MTLAKHEIFFIVEVLGMLVHARAGVILVFLTPTRMLHASPRVGRVGGDALNSSTSAPGLFTSWGGY